MEQNEETRNSLSQEPQNPLIREESPANEESDAHPLYASMKSQGKEYPELSLKTSQRFIDVDLTEQDIKQKEAQFRNCYVLYGNIEQEAKKSAADYKSRLTRQRKLMDSINETIQLGKEQRLVACVDEYDYTAKTFTIRAVATGEVVSSRSLRPDEQQRSLLEDLPPHEDPPALAEVEPPHVEPAEEQQEPQPEEERIADAEPQEPIEDFRRPAEVELPFTVKPAPELGIKVFRAKTSKGNGKKEQKTKKKGTDLLVDKSFKKGSAGKSSSRTHR